MAKAAAERSEEKGWQPPRRLLHYQHKNIDVPDTKTYANDDP